MKPIISTTVCIFITLAAFGQSRTATVGVSSNTSQVQVGNSSNGSAHNNSSKDNGSYNYSLPTTNTHSTNDYGGSGSSSNNNNSNSYYNNNSNSNSYSNNNYNSNYYNNNSYYNNNNYNYSNYNNNNYSTYTNKSYKAKDENYGTRVITEDKSATATNAFNTTDRISNYKTNNAINRLFTDNQKPSQIFMLDAQKDNNLKAADGTIIKIAANSFVDKEGKVVQGEVEFEVKEVYGRADMILSNAHTVANDMPLISGGEMYMGATKNGQALMLANNKPISVEMPTTSTGNDNNAMQLFYGKPNGNTVNWTLGSSNTVTPVTNPNTTTGYSYNFNVGALGWMNCDMFMNTSRFTMTKVTVNVPRQYDTTNTAMFIVFKGQNTVTKFDHFTLYNDSRSTSSSFDTWWYSVPVGSEVTIVALSEMNGNYYYSMKKATLVKDHQDQLVFFEPTTMDIFKEEMAKLQ